MDFMLPNTHSSTNILGMDFGWGPYSHAALHNTPSLENTDLPSAYSPRNEDLFFAEAISTFTYQELTIQKQDYAAATVDPAKMWSDSSKLPINASGHSEIHRSLSKAEIEKINGREGPFDTLQSLTTASESEDRDRHAANQRRRKARKSGRVSYLNSSTNEANSHFAEKKHRVRQKNKVAAAKCRLRQKKQTQTTESEYERLSEDNAQLKSCVQELRQELNELNAFALGHADCDCPIVEYNRGQAKRVMARCYFSKQWPLRR